MEPLPSSLIIDVIASFYSVCSEVYFPPVAVFVLRDTCIPAASLGSVGRGTPVSLLTMPMGLMRLQADLALRLL